MAPEAARRSSIRSSHARWLPGESGLGTQRVNGAQCCPGKWQGALSQERSTKYRLRRTPNRRVASLFHAFGQSLELPRYGRCAREQTHLAPFCTCYWSSQRSPRASTLSHSPDCSMGQSPRECLHLQRWTSRTNPPGCPLANAESLLCGWWGSCP